tara:strand:- start:214 stop:429 length:216 start_codon:yes stop_codon:yes gene_type:complete
MLKVGDLIIYNDMYDEEEFGVVASVQRYDSKLRGEVVEVYWFSDGDATTELVEMILGDEMEYAYIRLYSRA